MRKNLILSWPQIIFLLVIAGIIMPSKTRGPGATRLPELLSRQLLLDLFTSSEHEELLATATITRPSDKKGARMRNRSSKATWNAVSSMFGPYFIANVIMLVAIIFFWVTQPKINDPSTYWSIALVGLLLLAAALFVVKGARGLRRVNADAREDRR